MTKHGNKIPGVTVEQAREQFAKETYPKAIKSEYANHTKRSVSNGLFLHYGNRMIHNGASGTDSSYISD